MSEQAYEMAYVKAVGEVPEKSYKGWRRAGPTLASKMDSGSREVFVQDETTGYANSSKKYIKCTSTVDGHKYYCHCKDKTDFIVARPVCCRPVNLVFARVDASTSDVSVKVQNALTGLELFDKVMPIDITLSVAMRLLHDSMVQANLITAPTQLKLASLSSPNTKSKTILKDEGPKKMKTKLAEA